MASLKRPVRQANATTEPNDSNPRPLSSSRNDTKAQLPGSITRNAPSRSSNWRKEEEKEKGGARKEATDGKGARERVFVVEEMAHSRLIFFSKIFCTFFFLHLFFPPSVLPLLFEHQQLPRNSLETEPQRLHQLLGVPMREA